MVPRTLLVLLAASTLTACTWWPSDSDAAAAGTSTCAALASSGVDTARCQSGFLEGWQAGRAAGGYIPEEQVRAHVSGWDESALTGYLAGVEYARDNAP